MEFLINVNGADVLCLKPEHVKEMFVILAQNGPDISVFKARNKDVGRAKADPLQGHSN